MIKNIIPYAALTLAVSFTACSGNDAPAPAGPTSLVLMANIYDIDTENSSIWHSGQPFGVYMTANDNTPVEANAKHIADNRGVTGYLVPENSSLALPADGSPVNITAYYPYDENAADNGHRTTITVNARTAADACLWATVRNVTGASPKVTMGFKSQLAKIHIRLLNDDPRTARIVAQIEGAPFKCDFDILNGRYTGNPDCSSPVGMTIKNLDGAFELTAVVAATESLAEGPSLTVTALDNSGNEIRKYPAIPLGKMMELENNRTFAANTIYNLAGNLSAEALNIQFTGSSPICILHWDTDPDEEYGTIIKK